MENQETKQIEEQQEIGTDKYLSAINKLKGQIDNLNNQNKKLEAENRELFNSVMDGKVASSEVKKDNGPTKKELIEKLVNVDKKPMTNLEYVDTTLKLRNRILEEGGRDPFLPSESVQLTANEEQQIQQYVDTLQEAVDEADGDPVAFNILFNNIVKDTKQTPRR